MKSKWKARLPLKRNADSWEVVLRGLWLPSPYSLRQHSDCPPTPQVLGPPQLLTFPFDSKYGGPAISGQQTRLRLIRGGSWSLGPVTGFPWMVGWLGLEQMPNL